MAKINSPILLVIIDGWGLAQPGPGNAIDQAHMKTVISWKKKYPWTAARAAGESVGLPPGQMGNSEVGHIHIGAGRIYWGSLARINHTLKENKLATNSALQASIKFCHQHTGRFHFWGLLSDGGVHSNIRHLLALFRIVAQAKIKHIFFHLVADGRDTRPQVFLTYWQQLKKLIAELKVGQVVTIAGRFYAMDRDKRFERTGQALKAMITGEGIQFKSVSEYVAQRYQSGETDEFFTPGINSHGLDGVINSDDVVFAFNFRTDRAIQMNAILSNQSYLWRPTFSLPSIYLVTMVDYGHLVHPQSILFPAPALKNCLGSWLSQLKYRQLRAAETEKIAHVTFFFDGGKDYFANGLAHPEDITLPGADILLVPSPKVETYDLKPAMSCEQLTTEVIKKINLNCYDLIVLNYANPDMVGHTGVLTATIKANQILDQCLTRLFVAVQANHGLMIVTADHGNAEAMINVQNGEPDKKHTTNLVPILLLSKKYRLRDNAQIADIAPTILELMGVVIPPEMTTKSLLIKN